MRFWTVYGGFFREFRRQFHTTGAILPSSRFLARALTSQMRQSRRPARILEVGPGTGAVTNQIVKALQPDDVFDAVEINEQFVKILQQRFDHEKLFRPHTDQINLIQGSVEELLGNHVYDFIISGLPLNNFACDHIRRIFQTFHRLLKPTGSLSYYEYTFVRQLKVPFVKRQERRRLLKVGRVLKRYIRNYEFQRERILINVPPATVRHLRFGTKVKTPTVLTPEPEMQIL